MLFFSFYVPAACLYNVFEFEKIYFLCHSKIIMFMYLQPVYICPFMTSILSLRNYSAVGLQVEYITYASNGEAAVNIYIHGE